MSMGFMLPPPTPKFSPIREWVGHLKVVRSYYKYGVKTPVLRISVLSNGVAKVYYYNKLFMVGTVRVIFSHDDYLKEIRQLTEFYGNPRHLADGLAFVARLYEYGNLKYLVVTEYEIFEDASGVKYRGEFSGALVICGGG